MARRLMLVGFLVLMSGSMLQIILGTLFSAGFLLYQVQASPYTSAADDQLAASASFSLIVLFLCDYAFKDAALLDLPDIQQKMSREQKDIYVLNTLVLSFILVGALVGTLLVSLVLFAITYRQERARTRALARSARARRLRYLADDREVELRKLPPLAQELERTSPNYVSTGAPVAQHGPFHLFLSHNWKHGQEAMRCVTTRLKEMVPECSIFLDVDYVGGGSDYPHIDLCDHVLCYLTVGWLNNPPCIREVVRAMVMGKPLIALLEPDSSDQHGGRTEAECASRSQLRDLGVTPCHAMPCHA